ncbi:MAG: site-specific tyrosine recombinase XerC [Betaproteobacteria bacterium]|nr:MAG: site-specific tyrosine recombinase XerC [Betaproteobacteria bacterium]
MGSTSIQRNKRPAPAAPVKATRKKRVSAEPEALAHNALTRYQAAFHEWEAVVGYSPRTIAAQRHAIGRFIAWADERGLDRPQDITRPILERYQRHVYHYRKHNGQPLAVSAQLGLILPLQAWFKWLTKQNHILYNPAADLDLPSRPKALPKGLLSVAQIEDILNGCDVAKPEGIRMRAMLETFYSTGIRRFELAGLKLFDVDTERGALMVRQGKGAKDRLVPVGDRACAWLDKYLREVRPDLATSGDDYTLFLDDDGRAFDPGRLGDQVKKHLTAAGVTHAGACHLFRVACATHMLENGADIRFIQSLLGHAKLDTTQIYTQVSLAKLKEVHNATHPARLQRRQATSATADEGEPHRIAADAQEAFLELLAGRTTDDDIDDA